MCDTLVHMLEQFQDRKPSHVLFTSFTFSAGFFESNVLPLLCGYTADQLHSAKVRPDALNEALETIRTMVVCDRSAQPDPKGDYRYGLMTVGLEHGRFHPKLILMAGTLQASGKPGLWLAVASANIGIAGWGRQREVVGAIAVGTDHAEELLLLMQWLSQQADAKASLAPPDSQEEGNVRSILSHLCMCLSKDVPKRRAGAPTLHMALPPPIRPKPASLLAALAGGKSWDSVTIVSPFWSGVPKLLEHIDARKVQLVPSLAPAGSYSYPAFPSKPDNVNFQHFKDAPPRYTHAKAILLAGTAKENKYVLCIGSANFTSAAMLHHPAGQNRRAVMNVEAMLRYSLDRDPWPDMFGSLAYEQTTGSDDQEQGAPPLPPFDAEVLYDWQSGQFICNISRVAGSTLASVTLEIGKIDKTIRLDRPQPKPLRIAAVLRRPTRSYKLSYQDAQGRQSYVGLVTQLNASASELGYVPRPRLDLILESLHRLVPGKPGRKPRQPKRGGKAGPDDDGIDPDGTEQDKPAYDFFSFFRATEKLYQYNQSAPQANRPYSSMGHSLCTLHEAVRAQPIADEPARIGRYVQMAELRATIDRIGAGALLEDKKARSDMIAAIDTELQQLGKQLQPLLLQSPHFRKMFGTLPSNRQASAFLEWFRKEMEHHATSE